MRTRFGVLDPSAASTVVVPGSPDDRSTAFAPNEGGNEIQSGERLLVEAYAAIWLILFVLVLFSWRRQKALDARIAALASALAKQKRDG